MSYAIAAAGTGGHVYPGLAVGEALVEAGVPAELVLYVGGRRLEAEVYPRAGFPFLAVELAGLQRRLTTANLRLPRVVWRAVDKVAAELRRRRVRVLLGMGGYVTVPAVLAARRAGAVVVLAEQNAHAGLANRVMAPFARRVFTSFPSTKGLPRGEWVGNPVRASLARFDRQALRPAAQQRYRLDPELPTLGVFGGSLGAGALNRAVAEMLASWSGPPMQVVHLAGAAHADDLAAAAAASPVPWVVLGFEEAMEYFFAVCDLVLARAGGAVAELTATATPAVLVPGGFGSAGHQAANAAALQRVGAAEVVPEDQLGRLAEVVAELLADPSRRAQMAAAAAALARPQAGAIIAGAMRELHG